jgi:hypothetical protein
VVKVLRGLTSVPSFLRCINRFVASNADLLDSSLAFLLDQPELLDLANKTAYVQRRIAQLRADVEGYGYYAGAAPRVWMLARGRCWWVAPRVPCRATTTLCGGG